ncbi:hypothetical protein AAG570_010406 [Ranatra chinensis]|uniref:G-protein coupled receptors family 1 profile domain-containing protein n=1 Tax=Ranatra chinensis TaxID=642074 RepID=A0ABD0YMF8_9HEMI
MFYQNKKQETTEIGTLKVASERRNTFYQNNKQETTEIGDKHDPQTNLDIQYRAVGLSQNDRMQSFQSKTLRTILDAPWIARLLNPRYTGGPKPEAPQESTSGLSAEPRCSPYHSLWVTLLEVVISSMGTLPYSLDQKSNSVRTRRASQCGGGGGGGGCGGLDCEGSRRSSNSVFSALLFREEGRAVKTGFMVVGSYLFCWAPYFVSTASEAWGGVPLPRHLVVLCVLSSSSLNPFIYVFRNDLVRKETRRLMCWWREGANQSLGGGRGSAAGKDGKGAGRHAGGGGGRGGGGEQPTLRQQSSSQCDSVSVQSLQVSTMGPLPSTPLPNDCCKHLDTPPPADFVATYHQVSGDATRYESVTFRLAQRRCQSCIRQNSDSSTGSGHPLLTPTRRQPSSEPSTPRHITNNNTDEKNIVFKFQLGGDDLEAAGPRRHKLERHSAIDDTATDV